MGWQIFGDPDAADIVFTSGANILAVGINVTHQVVMTGNALLYLVTRQVKVLDNVKPTFIWSVLINQKFMFTFMCVLKIKDALYIFRCYLV